ncbi:MAG: hypothetical protein AAB353_09200 [Candidatus Hydrogenedentota bacterium]
MKVIAPVLVPAALAGAMLLAAWGPWARAAPERRGWGGVLALMFAFASGYIALVGAPEFPPVGARETLFWAVAFSALLAGAEWIWGINAAVSLTVRFLASALIVWFVFASLRKNSWSGREAAFWVGGIAAVTASLAQLVDRAAQRDPGPWLPATLWLICSVAAVAMFLGSTALMAQLCGALAAAFGAAGVLAIWKRDLSLARGGITVFITAYAGLLWQAHFYAELPLQSVQMLCLAPLAVVVVPIYSAQPLTPWKRWVIQLSIASVPLILALAIAYRTYRQNQSADEYVY